MKFILKKKKKKSIRIGFLTNSINLVTTQEAIE